MDHLSAEGSKSLQNDFHKNELKLMVGWKEGDQSKNLRRILENGPQEYEVFAVNSKQWHGPLSTKLCP